MHIHIYIYIYIYRIILECANSANGPLPKSKQGVGGFSIVHVCIYVHAISTTYPLQVRTNPFQLEGILGMLASPLATVAAVVALERLHGHFLRHGVGHVDLGREVARAERVHTHAARRPLNCEFAVGAEHGVLRDRVGHCEANRRRR